MSAKVAGLDLSMTATGVVDVNGHATTIKPTQKGDQRLVYIAALVVVTGRDADLVVIEDLPTHAHSAGITGMVHGAARLVLLNQGTRYVLITPATLKKFATGRGNAGKPDMAVALFKRAGLELGDDNQVDAWWLRAAGLELLGEPVVQLPAAQVAALDKVRDQLAVPS
jgi:Holliday junction resolvasome RuvABC endonuclease subunit